MPSGCSSGGNGVYNCGSITFSFGDSVDISGTKPATININGTLTTNNVIINQSGSPNDLNIVATGNIQIDYNASINANILAGSITGGNQAVIYGSITTSTGSISLDYAADVRGGLVSTSGDITLATSTKIQSINCSCNVVVGDSSVVYGNTSSNTLSDNGAHTVYQGSISTTSSVKLGYGSSVLQSIVAAGTIQMVGGSSVAGCVQSTGSNNITLGYNDVVNGVCCGSSSCNNSCVTNNTGASMPQNCSLSTAIEFNSAGGTTSNNGLHFYIDKSTQVQVKRLNNTGQVYKNTATPPSTSLDNGIFLRANGKTYGPDHSVTTFNVDGNYSTNLITTASPSNPPSYGVQQTATSKFGVTSGPQVSVVWAYTNPFDFITLNVTITIPPTYQISAINPVRYYHVYDTFLGGSDSGCGVKYTDSNGKLVIGTYPPVSGSSCPSSTSLPTGVSVVESFRERSGLNFSNYCSSGWKSFWVNGTTNCSVLQSADMSNDITSTYQDTGIGIEYSFIAPGTYSFSYDFVVGSPNTPPYDHLEITHSGTSNLCPTNITVKACLSSALPCPANSVVSTGTLTGGISVSPSSPSVTASPTSFSIGSGTHTQTISLTGSSPGGLYTLTASGLSTVPLNGVKCWNTTTSSSSCLYTVTNSACVSNFECMETGLPYNNLVSSPSSRNPLYTELAGTGFTFDVVALQSNGQQATSYTANSGVTVQLFDDGASPQLGCSAYSSPIASQAITFSSTDLGRKTTPANFTLYNAYRKVRCRVVDINVGVKGCSSDDFAVRPSSFTITSTGSADADATGVSTTASPKIKTGANFSLTATANAIGYDGVPSVDNTKLLAQTGAAQAGSVSGSFGTANATTSMAIGSSFKYSEVGYFRLSSNGVYDSTFTAVDAGNGDCNAGFNASGSLNACSFGNAATSNYFGRFYPDHFAVTPGTSTPACSNSFTYFGQDGISTAFTLSAQNSSNVITQNYTGGFAKLGLSTWTNYNFTAAILPSGAVLAASTTAPTGSWSNGSASVVAKHQISRPTAAAAPTNITISAAPTDSDGVTMVSAAVSTASSFKYGRLFMPNTYGSELLALNVPIEAQYWSGSAYQRNQQDSCSVIPTSSIAMASYKGNLAACETALSGAGTMSAGKVTATLSKPGSGNNGSVDLTVNLTSASGSYCTATSPSPPSTSASATAAALPWFGSTNSSARATFGLFKTPVIYMRENFGPNF